MRIFLAFLCATSALAQFKSHNIQVIVDPAGTTTGSIFFDTSRADGNFITLKAPTTATANYTLTLPQSAPATNGECLTSTTAGALSFAACGGSINWVASGLNSTHSGGAVVIRNGYGASTLSGAINSTQTTITVADGASFVSGKHIRIDSEVMLVTGISGNDLTVTRGANLTAAASHADGATVGTAGFLEVQQGNGDYPWRLSNGMWFNGAVPYFRPTAAGPGILDVSSNGAADAWIDICGTDVETGIVAFECLELRSNRSEDGGSTYGHVGMKAFGSGTTVRDLAINENGAQVTIGGNTFSNNLRVQASASDAKGITIHGTAAPGLEITDGTDTVYVGLSTGANKYFPASVDGNLALRSSNGIGFTSDAGTTTHLLIAAGASKFNTHITTGSPSAFDIGDATNYFQTLYVENIDATAGAVANQYLKTRKLEVADIAGSAGFWDHRSQGSFLSNSSYTIRDNGGSRWIAATRAVSGSAQNRTNLYTDLIPSLRATADGDAVNDSTLPASGASTARWSATWTTNLNASGTITFPTGAAAGRVWTSDGSGNGSWVAPSTSQWTTSGSDIYYTAGKITVGSATAGTDLINMVGSFPGFGIRNTGAAANERIWRIYSNESDRSLTFLSVNDALSAASVPFEIVRNSGTHTTQFVRIAKDGGATSVGGSLAVTGATTLSGTLGVTGAATFAGVQFAADNAHTVGTPSVAPSIVYGRIVNTRKVEITDNSGGTGFWDQRVNASGTSSDWALRDNAGSRMIRGVRNVGGSPVNFFEVFGEMRPARRSTGGGDAVNDTPYPGLGNTTDRWASIWGDAATITNLVTAGSVSAGTITASTSFGGGLDGVTVVGSSSVRMGNVWTYNINAAGTVKLGTSSTVGQVWTATDTIGNGTWGAAGVTATRTISTTSPLSGGGDLSANRTLSCSTCATTDTTQTISGQKTFSATTTFSGDVNISGLLRPGLDGIGSIGTTSLRYGSVATYDLNVRGTVTAPDNNTGISATVTVRNAAGTGTCTLIFSGGLLTGGTC